MGDNNTSSAIGQALVEFTVNGAFPEEDASALKLSSQALPEAIHALSEARSKLEVCRPVNYTRIGES